MTTATFNLLAISVGNTRTRIGAFVDSKLEETETFANDGQEDLLKHVERSYSYLHDRDNAYVLLSSVNPSVATPLEHQLPKHIGRDVHRVERDIAIPIGRQLDREAIIGEDRLLNAAAAYDVLKQACVVIDAGTATTVDLVDGAGTFHGGAILPGVQLMLDSLASRTAQLPETTFERPEEAVGHNTIHAMQSGVFHGTRGAVRELVEQFAEQIGAFPMVVATGGDANTLLRDNELIDRIVPNLTLMGLATTLRRTLEESK